MKQSFMKWSMKLPQIQPQIRMILIQKAHQILRLVTIKFQFLFLLQTNYILYSFQDAILPIIAATYDLEDECLAGSESSEDGIIRKSPLPQPDKMIADRWKCLRCGILNVPPMRFCHKCYEVLISIFSFNHSFRIIFKIHFPLDKERVA